MTDFLIKMLLGQILAFLASTIKNPKSVAKWGKVICTVRDGFNSLGFQFGCDADASAVGAKRGAAPKFDIERIAEAQRELLN